MKIDDFMSLISSTVSPSWAEPWDNCGVTVRARSDSVDKIAVALDPSVESVIMAESEGCNCLLTHHPLIFSPIRNLSYNEPVGAALSELILREMSAICCHTNWDSSPVGTNVSLAKAICMDDVRPLISGVNGRWGDGAVGEIGPLSMDDLMDLLKARWGVSFSRVWGNPGNVSRVAICGGSGGALWKNALSSGAQVYVTADLKYHDVQDALFSGLSLIQLDHGEMEWATMADLAAVVSCSSGIETVLLPISTLSRSIL